MVLVSLLSCLGVVPMTGCGGGQSVSAAVSKSPNTSVNMTVSPLTQTVVAGATAHFAATDSSGNAPAGECVWTSANSAILKASGSGDFVAVRVGSTSVSIQCGEESASASAVVTTKSNPNAIQITAGGVYSGNWSSTDPQVPAVVVNTNDPVTLVNSTVSGKGTLILANGSGKGADLTLLNITGTGNDPGVKGMARGAFLDAEGMSRLSVTQCTMREVSFGIYVAGSTLDSLTISNNIGQNLDDRISDGMGGYLTDKRVLGHFIILNSSNAVNGADISWNQITNDPGVSSIEDVINIYQSHGDSSDHIISVHDNYIQGAFATGLTTWYTGAGIQIDGSSSTDPSLATAFVTLSNNTVVHSAGSGISIAAGHDITVESNRVVSCGVDANRNWIDYYGSAYVMWNYYQQPDYSNNQISGNTGGMLIAGTQGLPQVSNFDLRSLSTTLLDTASNNNMDKPCLAGGKINTAAEGAEWTAWQARVASHSELLGDQH